jgi:ADP-heptose:LPS heptosyltransferase
MRKTEILCILRGGIGDQILAVPAVRYLVSTLPSAALEVRIGVCKVRRKLLRALLDDFSRVRSLEALWRQPRASFKYNIVLDLDTRNSPYAAIPPQGVNAEQAYFSFSRETRVHNQVSLKLYDSLRSPFWQRCFEMAFRAACLVNGRAYSRNEMLTCRDGFRIVPLSPGPQPTRRSLTGLLSLARDGRSRLAITPGGYNPPYKRWPIERFARVIHYALSKGIDVFVLASRAEDDLIHQLDDLTPRHPYARRARPTGNLTFLNGQLALEELPPLLRQMDLHLSNDNGIAHLAGILNRPQIILYRGTASLHLSVGFNDVTLFSGDRLSMQPISTATVVKTLDQMLPISR